MPRRLIRRLRWNLHTYSESVVEFVGNFSGVICAYNNPEFPHQKTQVSVIFEREFFKALKDKYPVFAGIALKPICKLILADGFAIDFLYKVVVEPKMFFDYLDEITFANPSRTLDEDMIENLKRCVELLLEAFNLSVHPRK